MLEPRTTKAAVLVETKAPLQLAELELPQTLSFGQVLVKVHYSGICGAQLNEIEGAKGPDKFLPHLLGHEGSGTVLDIGAGVRTVKKGDHVVLHWRPSAGLQAETPTYRWNGTRVNAGWVTTFNDHAIVSENRLTAIPDDVDLRVAPLFGCAVTTAMGVVNRDAAVQVGQSVVVFGVGGVGVNIVQSAAMVSAYPIVAVDVVESKVEWARKFGATHAFNSKTGSDGPHIDIPRYLRLMRAGKLSLDGLVTHEFPLEDVNDAIATVRRGEAGRVLLKMD